MQPPDLVTERMQSLIDSWETSGDRRAEFLRCYVMMTRNMHTAITAGEFKDSRWVTRLLEHFSSYYFKALEAYEREPTDAPKVWQLAHNAARSSGAVALQNLLLGINAHINYDLVLTMAELLEPEWEGLSESQRTDRFDDYCFVNEIIARTIDTVQDQVLEPSMPVMELIDRLFGRLDELLISRMITAWRDEVWQKAIQLLELRETDRRFPFVQQIEKHALKIGNTII